MTHIITCDGDLSIRQISEIQSRIMAAIDADSSILIDVSADARPDISFLQLIEAARVQARLDEKSIALAAPADGPLLDALTRAGFLASGEAAAFWLHEDAGR